MARKQPNRRKGPSTARLASFRPVLDRLIFGVALLGMLTTAHLYIQQERGFDRGCLGFSEPTQEVGCAVVTTSEASQLFGVSNAVWGFLFYGVIVALTFALPFVADRRLLLLKRLRAGLIGFGFLYSVYLVYYQYVELDTFCVLCLTSAGIEAVLFILQAVDFFQPPSTQQTSAMPASSMRQGTVMGALVVLLFVLVGADFAYFNSLDRAAASADRLTLDEQAAQPVADAGEGAPAVQDDCGYDPEKDPVADYNALVSALDPMKGNPEAPVTVVEYFDPNCPHCRTLYPIMEQLAQQYGEQARFVYKPFVLWQHSVAQSAALYAAAQEGKFFEMLELQFANQQPRGLSAEQLQAIAQHIGMNPSVLMQRIQSGIYMTTLQQVRNQGQEIGINSVPAVLINGRFVDGNRSVECLGQLIEEAAE